MSQVQSSSSEDPAAIPRQRLESLDAFRGFTIAGMIFVIMVSGYKNLPHTFPAFGSAPVSTWKHVGARTLMLIGAGILYIALALKGITWWWGILQAIGIAYFLGAAALLLPPAARWGALAAVAAAHAALSWHVPWWTHIPADMS